MALMVSPALQFNTLRHSKYATMMLLWHLHNTSDSDMGNFTCNACDCHLTTVDERWHCTVCEDYDLCADCAKDKTHEHPVQRVGMGSMFDDRSQQDSVASMNAQGRVAHSLQRTWLGTESATRCRSHASQHGDGIGGHGARQWLRRCGVSHRPLQQDEACHCPRQELPQGRPHARMPSLQAVCHSGVPARPHMPGKDVFCAVLPSLAPAHDGQEQKQVCI